MPFLPGILSACGVNGMINAVLFVIVDTNEGGGFGEDERWCGRWSAHSTHIITNSIYKENAAGALDLSGFMSPDPVFTYCHHEFTMSLATHFYLYF
jgi:hypothetical protein